MDKLLTIAIPTYNRGTLLKDALRTAIPQVRFFKDEVSIFVSDNASDDNTQTIVEEFLQDNSDILTYHRHKKNIGSEKNYAYAVAQSHSKYVCLLGDDDILFPCYVAEILRLLRSHPDVAVLYYNVMTVNYSLNNPFLRDKHIESLTPIVYETGKELIYNHLEIPSLLSSTVFNRESFLQESNQMEEGRYPGYDWLSVLYHSCLYKKCIFYSYPLVLQRVPNETEWIRYAPWYTIYGFGRLFKELDSEIPGLFNRWTKHCSNGKKDTMDSMLKIVNKNQDFYKEKYEQMKPYMYSPQYVKLFYLNINHSETWVEFLSSPIRFILRRIRRAMHL